MTRIQGTATAFDRLRRHFVSQIASKAKGPPDTILPYQSPRQWPAVVRNTLFFAICIMLCAQDPAFANAKSLTAPTCADYYEVLKLKLSDDYNPLLKLRHALLRTGIGDNVIEGKPLAGQFGGTRRTFTKKDPNTPWERYFDTPGFNDVLVNPDSLVHILGSENAKKFGFELFPDKAVIPDVTEFRAAIQSFNRQFPEGDPRRLSINFYETGNKPITGEQYRDSFLNQSELPMAKSGRLHFHDFSAHAGAAFMPKEIVDETRLRIRLFSEFDEYLKKTDPRLRRLVSDLYRKRVDNIIDTHSNQGQNNLIDVASSTRGVDLYLQMHQLSSNIYAVRASDDVSEALLELLQYVNLSPAQGAALSRHVKAYIKEQVAKNPKISELPFGVRADSSSQKESDQVRARTAEIISDRLRQLRSAFGNWNP